MTAVLSSPALIVAGVALLALALVVVVARRSSAPRARHARARFFAIFAVLLLLAPPTAQAMAYENLRCRTPERCVTYAAGLVVAAAILGPALVLYVVQNGGVPSVQAQLDGNGDGYGDEWFSPYANYAQDLVDKLQDPENNFQGDGLPNLHEFRWQTVPIGPFGTPPAVLFANAMDFDGDNWTDGGEVNYWNDSSNDPKIDAENPTGVVPPALAVFDPDYGQNFDGDQWTTTHDPDSDNDGLLDGDEAVVWKSYPEFKDSDCYSPNSCPSPSQVGTTWAARSHEDKPGVGDNLTDAEELARWNALDPNTLNAWRTDYDKDGIASNLLDPDSDSDGVLDGDEFRCRTLNSVNPTVGACTRADMFDTDGDGASDGTIEALARTDPLNPDTDGDGMPDGWEYQYKLDPRDGNDRWADPDADGLNNYGEYSYRCGVEPCPTSPAHWSGLDPHIRDMDNDAMLDGREVEWDADPFNPDSDFDGLRDGPEDSVHFTRPVDRDTDDDGLTDYQEVITYKTKNPDPTSSNTDGGFNNTNNDTLSDYAEIVQFKTNVTHWDTDNDGVADGRDARPLAFDAQPTRVDLSSAPSMQPRQDAYVVFRDAGYVDVMVQDTHGAEGDIQGVEVRVRLDGTVNGAPGYVTIRQEAQRLDDGTLWGARIALPSQMSQATSESFILTVVGSSGNVASYTGSATETMQSVTWNNDPDPVNPSDWSHLRVHDSPGNTPSGSAAPSMSGPDVPGGDLVAGVSVDASNLSVTLAPPDPWSMSAEELFAEFGGFAVYRLKPFALPAEALSSVPVPEAYATYRTISVGVENATGADLDDMGWNITLFEDAFELVDPSQEPGVYASMASGGSNYFRMPKALRTGLLWGWDKTKTASGIVAEEAVAQGASFLFGSDDPRAKGRLSGDIVAGILVYGDVRDVVVGTIKEDEIKVALGGIGIGLTFVGPGADGPFAAFKSGVKLIKSVPSVGPRVALKFVTDVSDAVKAARSAGDGPAALRFVADQGDLALWAVRNTDKLADYERVSNAVNPATMNALKNQMDNVVALSQDVGRVHPGDEAGATQLLRQLAEPSTMFGSDSAKALSEVSAAAEKLRAAVDEEQSAQIVGDFVKDIHALRNVDNSAAWWRDIFGGVAGKNDNGRLGYAFEAQQAAKIQRAGALERLDDDRWTAFVNGVEKDVQLDALARVASGKFLVVEVKGGKSVGMEYAEQLEKQVILAADNALFTKEVQWICKNPPSRNLRDYAIRLMDERGVQIKFLDGNGNPMMVFVD